jgi:hypothetical protein
VQSCRRSTQIAAERACIWMPFVGPPPSSHRSTTQIRSRVRTGTCMGTKRRQMNLPPPTHTLTCNVRTPSRGPPRSHMSKHGGAGGYVQLHRSWGSSHSMSLAGFRGGSCFLLPLPPFIMNIELKLRKHRTACAELATVNGIQVSFARIGRRGGGDSFWFTQLHPKLPP